MNGFAGYPLEGNTIGGMVYAQLKWTSGATGAVPTFPSSFKYASNIVFKSVTRTGTGAYTIALQKPFYDVMPEPMKFGCLQASDSASGVCTARLIEDHSNNVTTPELKILTTNAAGAATDAASGDVITVTFAFNMVPVR